MNNKKPILINIHGGGFISSYKELDYLFCNNMAQKEFVVFNINNLSLTKKEKEDAYNKYLISEEEFNKEQYYIIDYEIM